MKCSVVTEGESDVVLLTFLLRPELDRFSDSLEIIAAGGWSGADSLARSILAMRDDEAVAVFADADTNDPQGVERRQRFLEDSLSQFGSPSRWEVLLVVPEIEALLFHKKQTLENLVGKSVSDEAMIRGGYEPRRVLEELMRDQRGDAFSGETPFSQGKVDRMDRRNFFVERLSTVDAGVLRDIPVIQELRRFVLSKVTRKSQMVTTASGRGVRK